MVTEPILECQSLKKYFKRRQSLLDLVRRKDQEPVQAVDDVSFSLHKGESIGIIGESGCGKTTLLKTLMGLHQPTDGELLLNGKQLSDFSKEDWMAYRRDVQIIFQDPYRSMDPQFTVRDTLLEPLEVHDLDDREKRLHEVLKRVELQPAEKYLDRRPGQLSGGEKQRVSIARALILEPKVLLADEPVSMLDVSTQAAILKLLKRLMDETDVSMVYISHDLSTVSYVCDIINVMYLGRIVEQGTAHDIINDPKHPYVQALIDAIPVPDPYADRARSELEGSPSDPIGLGEGCRFRNRCPERMDICGVTPHFIAPDESEKETERRVACHLYYDHQERSQEVPQEKVS